MPTQAELGSSSEGDEKKVSFGGFCLLRFYARDYRLIFNPQVRPQGPPDDLGLGSALLRRPLGKGSRLILMQVAHLTNEVRSGKALGCARRLIPALHLLKGYLMFLSTLNLG